MTGSVDAFGVPRTMPRPPRGRVPASADWRGAVDVARYAATLPPAPALLVQWWLRDVAPHRVELEPCPPLRAVRDYWTGGRESNPAARASNLPSADEGSPAGE